VNERPFTPLERLQAAVARGLARLPPRLRSQLSGPPPVVDGQALDPQIQLVRTLRQIRGRRELMGEPVEEARARFLREIEVFCGPKTPVATVRDFEIDGPAGPIPVRHYAPEADTGLLLVYLHGGGFMLGDLATHDEPCRMLCHYGQQHVLAVDYRLAPEHPFPAGLEDTLAALAWAQEHAASLGASPERIGIGGDSAGGNLAAVASAHAERPPAAQLLIYPATDAVSRRASEVLFGESYFLTSADRETFTRLYLEGSGVERADPRVSPLLATNLSGLPPALVVTAGFDLLRDEGEAYAEALRQSGVPVVLCRFPGLVHGFIHLTGLVTAAREAMTETSESWRSLCERTAGGST
jgi:acetyl esterase